jgi:CheY-like chemotaxis protein
MSRTVLLVEDEPDVLEVARLMLEEAGYAVVVARRGEEAIELAEKTDAEAMFLDLRMPGLDGWGVLEELRARDFLSRMPVIVLSAQADLSAVQRSVELGAKGFVKKPFRATDLARALEAVQE